MAIGGSRWASVWLEDNPLRRGLPKTSRSPARAWGVLWLAVSSGGSIVAGGLWRVLGSGTVAGSVILEGSCQETTALGSDFFEDFGGRRSFVVDGTDLVGSEILVVGSFETKGYSSFIVGVDTKLGSSHAPGQLLICNLVVAAIFDNMVEDLKKIKMAAPNLGLRVKLGASLYMESPQFVDEFFVLGGALNDVLRDGLLRRHRGGRLARDRRAQVF